MADISNLNQKTQSFKKNFDGWNDCVKVIDKIKSPLFDENTRKYRFDKGQIWYCSVGINPGAEICGKNDKFERPVLIISKTGDRGRHFICLPLTSEKPKNKNHFIEINIINHDNAIRKSFVRVTTPICYDVNRLIRKVKKLNDNSMDEILNSMKEYFHRQKRSS